MQIKSNILMNKEMTKAILDGRKIQIRRIVGGGFLDENEASAIAYLVKTKRYKELENSFGFKFEDLIGKIIRVREPVKIIDFTPVGNYGGHWNDTDCFDYIYLADKYIKNAHEIPNRFKKIPKWITRLNKVPNGCIKEMARIFLEITDIRVERLNDITFDGIKKEGLPTELITEENILEIRANGLEGSTILNWWIETWNKVAQISYKWEDNPYIFIYDFKRVKE